MNTVTSIVCAQKFCTFNGRPRVQKRGLFMKILIATECYIYNLGGIATSILSLCAGLNQCGHEVKVLSLSNTNKSFKEGNFL